MKPRLDGRVLRTPLYPASQIAMSKCIDAQHAGLPYERVDRFLEAAVPYLNAGVEKGEAVIAVTSKRNLDALRAELGPAARHIDLFENAQWYDSPARALTRYLTYWGQRCESGWVPLRMLGEPVCPHHDGQQVERWTAFESGINELMRWMPVRMLCAYDLSLRTNRLHHVEISHPHMAAGASTEKSSRFIEPESFRFSRWSTPLSTPKTGALCVPFERETLATLRASIEKFASEYGLKSAERIDLHLAVGEAAANAIKHGGGAGTLRMWRAGGEVVADVVCFEGRFDDVMLGYLAPPAMAQSGRGMWMIRQLCDWVEIRPRPRGSTVRMHLRVT